MTLLIVTLALVLDQFLGEAKQYHPLVGFGNCANRIEQRLNLDHNSTTSFFLGLTALIFLIIPLSLAGYIISSLLAHYSWIFSVIVVYLAIGFKSLLEHSERVFNSLPSRVVNTLPNRVVNSSPIDVSNSLANKTFSRLADHVDDKLIKVELCQARYAVSLMVSRNTEKMSETEIISATIESNLENGCDSTFGVLFWFLIGGVPMVIAYRLANTLDAMWGYRNIRFELFGKSAAKLDDCLNYIPARITALFFSLYGNTRQALNCWRTQAGSLASPNGGPVMTSGAGSLNIQLGGPAHYHGERLNKPFFGTNIKPQAEDITRANKLLVLTLLTWYVVIALTTLGQLSLGV
ncbi:MAG: adenosylcobinamide-phosphate synthase [Arenicella sp.]|jgi:adenosylcobinamide-phosphate synthase